MDANNYINTLGITNRVNAWDLLDQNKKMELMRKALQNGIVDVQTIKNMYNNQVLEETQRQQEAMAQQMQQQESPQLSVKDLHDIYNMVEGNGSKYACGGRFHSYSGGTDELERFMIPLNYAMIPNVYKEGGNKSSTKKRKGTTWEYKGKKDLVIPLDASPWEVLQLAGVPVNPYTQSYKIRPQNAKFGVKNSYHKKPWKGSKIYGSAVDLTPAKGYTYEDLFKALAHPAVQKWAKHNGFGLHDERTKEALAKTNGTGPHIHFGPNRVNLSANPFVTPYFSYWQGLGMKEDTPTISTTPQEIESSPAEQQVAQAQFTPQQIIMPIQYVPMEGLAPYVYNMAGDQDMKYEELRDMISNNFNALQRVNAETQDYTLLPKKQRVERLVPITPQLQESNVMGQYIIGMDDSVNMFKKGGKKQSNSSSFWDKMKPDLHLNDALTWKRKAEIDMMFDMFNKPLYDKNVYSRRRKTKEKIKENYKKEHPLSVDEPLMSKFIKTYQQEKEDKLKELQPVLDEMFPNKEHQKKVLDYLEQQEKAMFEKPTVDVKDTFSSIPILRYLPTFKGGQLYGSDLTLPPYTLASRLVDLYKQSNRPKFVSPSKIGILNNNQAVIPSKLWYWGDEPDVFGKDVLRPMTVPVGKSLLFSSLLPNPDKGYAPFAFNTMQNFNFAGLRKTRDYITVDESLFDLPYKSAGAQGYLKGIRAELPHSFINSHPNELLEYGMNGISYLDTLIDQKHAYTKKGTFENNTHAFVQPILDAYLDLKDADYKNMTQGQLNKAAYKSFDINTILNSKDAKRYKDYTEYIPTDLGLEYDVLTGYGQLAANKLVNQVGRGIIPESWISDQQLNNFYKNYVREPYRFVTNPKYTWKNYISPNLDKVGSALSNLYDMAYDGITGLF